MASHSALVHGMRFSRSGSDLDTGWKNLLFNGAETCLDLLRERENEVRCVATLGHVVAAVVMSVPLSIVIDISRVIDLLLCLVSAISAFRIKLNQIRPPRLALPTLIINTTQRY